MALGGLGALNRPSGLKELRGLPAPFTRWFARPRPEAPCEGAVVGVTECESDFRNGRISCCEQMARSGEFHVIDDPSIGRAFSIQSPEKLAR